METTPMTAEAIGKKARALKHCDKLLKKISIHGWAVVTLNSTGLSFVVHRDDAFYLKLMTMRAQLAEEINSYEILKKSEVEQMRRRKKRPARVRTEASPFPPSGTQIQFVS